MNGGMDVLSAENPFWKFSARELMERKKSFVVEKWTKKFDEVDSAALCKQFGYSIEYRNNDESQAFFLPGRLESE
jgi:hypothetical protein